MYAFIRTVGGVVIGMIVACVLIVAVEMFSAVVHPFPEGFGETLEEMCQHVENYPAWILAVVVPMWGAAALVGTLIARKIGGIYAFSIVGLLLLLGLVFNIAMLPYPLWFKIGTLIVIPAAIYLGSGLANRRTGAEHVEAGA